MARREHDFTAAHKDFVKAYFGNTCAICGDSNIRNLVVDHHISGDATDAGTCMCHYCNNLKGALNVPERFRFIPRDAVPVNSDYLVKIHENQDAFKKWLLTFRYFQEGRQYNLKNITFFVAPH